MKMTLDEACRKVLCEHQKLVEDYEYHKMSISGALVGHVLVYHYETKLNTIAEKIRKILEEDMITDFEVVFEE